jgi:hypothetical protein
VYLSERLFLLLLPVIAIMLTEIVYHIDKLEAIDSYEIEKEKEFITTISNLVHPNQNDMVAYIIWLK